MGEYSQKITDLKNLLLTADTLADVQCKFFDDIGMDPDFIAAGTKSEIPRLADVLHGIGKQLFGPDCTIEHVWLFRMEEERFVHGACVLNGLMTTILYYEDIDVGLFAISYGIISGEMTYGRISLMSGREGLMTGPIMSRHKTVQ